MKVLVTNNITGETSPIEILNEQPPVIVETLPAKSLEERTADLELITNQQGETLGEIVSVLEAIVV